MIPSLARVLRRLPLGARKDAASQPLRLARGATDWAGGRRSLPAVFLDRCANSGCDRVRGVSSLQLRLRPGRLLEGMWYCGPECWEDAAHERLAGLIETSQRARVPQHRVPLGLLMLSRGDITAAELNAALAAQRQTGEGRIGEWLRHMGAASEEQVTAALGQQWSAPLLTLRSSTAGTGSRLLPVALMEACRVLAVHWNASTRTLLTAFVDGIDYATLFSMQQALECEAEAGIISESGFERQITQIRQTARAREVGIRTPVDRAEMVRVLGNYCHRVDAVGARLFGCRKTLWARLDTPRGWFDVTFPCPEPAPNVPDAQTGEADYRRRGLSL